MRRPHQAVHPRLAGLLAALTSLAVACQAQREIVVTSQPEGAEVRLDGQAVGRTPATIPFLHYGTRRVTLYLDGYVTESRVVELTPPWYGRFPLDIVSEVLVPVGWHDTHRVHADLVPGTGAIPPPDLSSVLERAEELRRAGPEGPRPIEPAEPPAPPPPRRP